MDQKKIDRINFLAKKKKTSGLTEAETVEQAELRKEFMDDFKKNFRKSMENVVVDDENGNEIPLTEYNKKNKKD